VRPVTDKTPPDAPDFAGKRAGVAALIGVATHLLAFAVALVIAQLSKGGEGLRDLGAAVSAFFLIEIVAGLACVVGGGVLFVRGRRDIGMGLLAGWVLGMVFTAAYLFASAQ
jgi:hypothetical protein